MQCFANGLWVEIAVLNMLMNSSIYTTFILHVILHVILQTDRITYCLLYPHPQVCKKDIQKTYLLCKIIFKWCATKIRSIATTDNHKCQLSITLVNMKSLNFVIYQRYGHLRRPRVFGPLRSPNLFGEGGGAKTLGFRGCDKVVRSWLNLSL